MADEPDNIVLVYLRRIDEKLDRLTDDVRDLKVRVTALEESVVGVHRRMDRLEARIDRIERRLDLTEAPH
jgi:predicted  nucleic acid-binding Zn-ribbon protein